MNPAMQGIIQQQSPQSMPPMVPQMIPPSQNVRKMNLKKNQKEEK